MNAKRRKVIVLLLFLGFMLAAPAILLYASGYRYNWNKNKIEKTGIIRVSSRPSGATVYLNGRRHDEPTPTKLRRLLPEDYEISIYRTGYLEWNKTLPVESGRTTFAAEVVLLHDTLPKSLLSAESTASRWSPDATAVTLVRQDGDWEEMVTYDVRTGDTSLLGRFAAGRYRNMTFEPSADGTILAMLSTDSESGTERYSLYDIEDSAGPQSLELPTGEVPQTVRWSPAGRSLVMNGRSGTFVLDAETGETVSLPTGPHVNDVFFGPDGVWLVRETGETATLERIRPDGSEPSNLTHELPEPGYRIVDVNERAVLLANARANDGLAYLKADGRTVELPYLNGVAWELPNKEGRAVAWNDFEIFSLPAETDEAELVTRVGTPVLSCAWHPRGSHILYANPDGITAIELDARDRRNVDRLVDFGSIDSVAVDREAEILRFVGSIGNSRGVYERPL